MDSIPEMIQELIETAKCMPRATPKAGGCGTVHTFQIDAGTVWRNDAILKKFEALETLKVSPLNLATATK